MTTEYTPNFQLALPDFRMGPWHDLVNSDLKKIDTLLFNALSGTNVEVWQHSTDYHVGDNALDDSDATIWLCVIANTSPATGTFAAYRTAHPTHWTRLLTGFAPRGEWAQNTNYFPYDLTYDSARGIMALCTFRHTSTATGSIVDDQAYWAFLLDMSDVGQMTANAVSYSNLASGIPKTDVQNAIDYVETQVKGLDAVNVTQGNQITAIQAVDTTQNNRLGALETKTTYSGAITAPYFISTSGVTAQFGGGATVGYYTDPSNLALRPPGNGTVYFQGSGGAVTYGTWGQAGISVNGTISSTGAITAPSINIGSLNITSGGLYLSGWGGNGNISVIFLNAAQNHYLYHDGTNVSFSGIATVNAGNGRLWGNGDFNWPVVDGRLVYGGDPGMGNPPYNQSQTYEWGGAVITGWTMQNTPTPYGSYNTQTSFRIRYMQLYTASRGWYTIGYA